MDLIDISLREKLILLQKEEEVEVEEIYCIIIDQIVMFTITNTRDPIQHRTTIEEVAFMTACETKNSN